MGGICSKSATNDNVCPQVIGVGNIGGGLVLESHGCNQLHPLSGREVVKNQLNEPFSFPELSANSVGLNLDDIDDGIPRLSRVLSEKSRPPNPKQVAVAKVSEVGNRLGKAGTAGFGKAVEVLDTLGSGMTSLHLSGGFVSGVSTKGIKISTLAFEIANTIVKGANLMQSLSKENIKHLKEVVLRSEGVLSLISKDIDELQRIAAVDKREELKVFSGEVVRFGNRCKDPQYHNLDRYFENLASQPAPQKRLKEEAETIMEQLMTLVQYTAELYHESHALDRFEQDTPSTSQRGDSLTIRGELKCQRKNVRSLKKKSLWSKILEEIMEKFVDIVHFLHLEIREAFGSTDDDRPVKTANNHQKLGSAGLALHYASVITHIDTLVSRSHSVPPNTRDALYQGLPPNIRSTLRSKLQSFHPKEELTVPQIKTEMEKTLHWIVPIATNTTKAHHGFGWVGEWANAGSDVNQKPAGQSGLLRIETLYHADKDKTDNFILDLVVWLHYLISQSKADANCETRSPVKSPIRSPNQKSIHLSVQEAPCRSPTLTFEDQQMLQYVNERKLIPGISKSQEFHTAIIPLSKHERLSKSSSHSPTREYKREIYSTTRPSSVPIINFDIDQIKALDVIDRVDTLGTLGVC